MSLYRPPDAPDGIAALQAVQLRRGLAVGRAADVRAHGRARSSTSGRTRSRPSDGDVGVDLRLRPAAASPRTSSGCATSSRTRSWRRWRGELEDDGLNGLVLRRRAHRAARSRSSGRSPSTCGRPGSRSRTRTWSARCWRHPDIATLLVKLFVRPVRSRRPRRRPRPSSSAAEIGRGDRRGREPRRGPDPAQLPGTWSARCCAPTTSVVDDGRRARAVPLVQARPGADRRCCRCRGRSSRSSSTRRASRAFTCAAARSRAAGLRWSDRPEDFRTEVLGLMKAQMVKNALIVPVGSKGGFVRQAPAGGRRPRGAAARRRIACYQAVPVGAARPHRQHRRRRGRRPRPGGPLRRRRPLPGGRRRQGHGDVLRHRQRGVGPLRLLARRRVRLGRLAAATTTSRWGSPRAAPGSRSSATSASWAPTSRPTDFTVVGIGDMSGDVFGNGMLLSRHIKLRGRVQPPARVPRPRSRSGGQLRRAQAAVRAAALVVDRLRPVADLRGRRACTRAPRSRSRSRRRSSEALGIEAEELLARRADPGDPAGARRPALERRHRHLRQGVRRDARRRRRQGQRRASASTAASCAAGSSARAATSGFTQRGRIEYALAGGRINTDAIDNVAGVNCSDHEVNIKILLDSLVAAGELTAKQRNELLAEMTDAVAEQVLYGSYTQTQAMSLALAQAASMVDVHARLIRTSSRSPAWTASSSSCPTTRRSPSARPPHGGSWRPSSRW